MFLGVALVPVCSVDLGAASPTEHTDVKPFRDDANQSTSSQYVVQNFITFFQNS